MNRFAGCVVALMLAAASGRADILFYEGFDLAQGENGLANSAAGVSSVGVSGIWTGTTVDVSAGLTYAGLETVDGAARLDAVNSGATAGMLTGFNTGTVWISFLSVVSNATSYAGLSLYNSFNNERLFVGDLSGSTNWGFQLLGVGGGTIRTSAVSTASTSLLVMRIDFNVSSVTNENYYLWVNPTLGAEPDIASANTSLLGANLGTSGGNGELMTRIRIQGGSATDNAVVDELRIGREWEDVTPVVPEPGTAAALLTGLGMLVWWQKQSRSRCARASPAACLHQP